MADLEIIHDHEGGTRIEQATTDLTFVVEFYEARDAAR